MACAAMRKKFATMSRTELQKWAKLHGISTSLSTNELRRLLEEIHAEGEGKAEVEAVSKHRIAVPAG